MFDRKRLLSALLAWVVAVSSLIASPAVFATTDIEMTFDGQYLMTEEVDIDYLFTNNDPDVQDKVEKALEKATGVASYLSITYADLAKVKTFDLSGLDLVDVPYCINYMVNLTRLDLSSNLLESEALKNLSLTGCTKLSNINLSDNYLTTMPSWFVSDRVTSGNITKNFVDSQSPRFIKPSIATYYLIDGESLDEDNLKNQILKSICLDDGKLLPEIFFEYNSITPPYPKDPGTDYPYALDIINWESFVTDGKVVAPQNKTIEVTVQLFNDSDNDNTKTTVTIYLLNGKDLPSLKKRLEGLIAECDSLEEDAYTESSWNNFILAHDTAEAILKYEKADVNMLTNAFNALVKARDNLCYGTKDLSDTIKGLITVGDTYKQGNYTPSSWEAFSNALAKLKKISTDKDAKLETAQAAVREFQRAQAALRSAELKIPDIIPKSEFEKIYGESRNITTSGVTRAGTSYKWSFYGKDLKEIADFNPEVKDTDANESGILIEAGSSSGYRMFVTSADKPLPGKATLEIDVSDKFTSGTFYLYKWNTSAKRSLMVGTASVTNGTAIIPLTEGGVYYLCRNVQNFELKSRNYEVDNDGKTITIPPTSGVNVFEFKNSFEFGAYTTILDEDGKSVSSYSNVKTGMTINAPNMDKYTIKLTGDVDTSGGVDFDDVSCLIGVFLNGAGENDTAVYDLDGDGSVTFEDINLIIKYFLMVI
ncbi:MAG: dockerin type I domain-containing protein [Oscillospiraceae bacterium]